jgi:YVTN family beta-propeller protein
MCRGILISETTTMKVYGLLSTSYVMFVTITVVLGVSLTTLSPVSAQREALMYVTNLNSDTVSVIKTNTNALVGSPIAVGSEPLAIAYDPTHKRMYVTNVFSDTVSVIDTNTNTVLGLPLVGGALPIGIAFAPPQP